MCAYFNHAYKKAFVSTKGDATESGGWTPAGVSGENAGTNGGVLTSVGMHVSKIKSSLASEGMQLGVGVVGLFNAKTNLSVTSAEIDDSCCPFYLAGASLKLEDKQGPFHGGYQESNKSKVINPKYVRQTYYVDSNAAGAAMLQIGGTPSNNVTFSQTVPGTGYTTSNGVATTGGTGTGMLVDIIAVGGIVTSVVISNVGDNLYIATDVITITTGGADSTFTISAVDVCEKEFLCGETYYLRIDVKGTSALRFANHNLYRTLDASGGCCADPAVPVAVTSDVIYKQFVEQIATDPYLKDFILPILVVDGDSFAYDEASAAIAGLAAGKIIANAPAATTDSGMILMGAYVSTEFGDCTFQTSDYYGVEPIQIFASEVDLNGDPCTFGGMCVVESCPGVQANGTGEEKVREVILSESYLTNFMSSDLRIREITQGTRVLDVLTRSALYSSFYILHSVPRFNNPSGTFDNDQYLLEIIGDTATTAYLASEFTALEVAGCISCETPEDLSQASPCDIPALPTA